MRLLGNWRRVVVLTQQFFSFFLFLIGYEIWTRCTNNGISHGQPITFYEWAPVWRKKPAPDFSLGYRFLPNDNHEWHRFFSLSFNLFLFRLPLLLPRYSRYWRGRLTHAQKRKLIDYRLYEQVVRYGIVIFFSFSPNSTFKRSEKNKKGISLCCWFNPTNNHRRSWRNWIMAWKK